MKSPCNETVLSVIPGSVENERLLVVLIANQIQLRQQSWGEGVGWFTQSSVQLDSHQVADLRRTLGTQAIGSKPKHRTAIEPTIPTSSNSHRFRIVHADSA